MTPAPPLTISFFGGAAAAVAFSVADKDQPEVDKGVTVDRDVQVLVRLVDRHGNISPEFDQATVEVILSHGASGGGVVTLAQASSRHVVG